MAQVRLRRAIVWRISLGLYLLKNLKIRQKLFMYQVLNMLLKLLANKVTLADVWPTKDEKILGCKIKVLRQKTNTYIKTPGRGDEPCFVKTGKKYFSTHFFSFRYFCRKKLFISAQMSKLFPLRLCTYI